MLVLALVAFVSLSNCSTNPEETEPDKTEKPENPNGSNDSGDGSDENGGNDNTGDGGENGDGGDDNGDDNGGDDDDNNTGDGSGNDGGENGGENGDNGGSDNTGGGGENGDDDNNNGDNNGGEDDTGGGGDDNDNTGGGAGADKITHGPYKIGDWYNDGKNEGWVYYVEGDGYHGSIFSGHIGSVESCSLLEDYLKDIPEGWQLLSSNDISKIRDEDAKVRPELIDIVKQSFMVSKDVVSSQYYAGSDCSYHFFYADSELLCGVTHVGDGVKLNLCITYYF